MSRSISEIYEAITTAKDAETELNNLVPNQDNLTNLRTSLSTSSKTAVWRLFAYIIAVAIYIHEQLFNNYKEEIEAIVAAAPVGTLPWYKDQVLKYQFNDTLQYINERYQYSIYDESKQIVKLCAVEERAGGIIVIKVADLDSNQVPVALSATQKTALAAYIQKIKFAGVGFFLISQAADLLKINATIYFDPIYTQATIAQRVEQAILAYITNLPFNGVLTINALIDAVQAVVGVNDITVQGMETKYAALPYTAINRVHTAEAGYFAIDPLFPLSNTLTYQPSTI